MTKQEQTPNTSDGDGGRKFVPLQLPGRDLEAVTAAMLDEIEQGRERPAPWNMARLETPAERRAQERE